MNPSYVDFHCHLDLYPDFPSAIQEAEEAGVYTLTVTTTPKAWPRNNELTRGTRFVRAALGLHPQLVHERSNEIALWEKYLPETRYVGEVGIDSGPQYYRSIEMQKQIFERILQSCADAGGKILTVHSVRATKIVLDLVEKNLPSTRGQVVLHWFTGSKSEARRATELGCYFSVNSQMVQSEKGRELVGSLPLGRILTETDGPFTQHDGRPATPSDIPHVVDSIARIHRSTSGELMIKIRQNLKGLLAAP
jgi:TatD DNase family protein